MEQELHQIYNRLESIRITLRKLGPERRQKHVNKLREKLLQADEIYTYFKTLLEGPLPTAGEEQYIEIILDTLTSKIKECYNKIKIYCKVSQSDTKMEKFDLKTAAGLVPVMDGKQETVEKIIDSVQLYNDCLKEVPCKKLLANFVLKTRLSKAAKLKLKQEYSTCDDLLKDMKVFLLTKKSPNALLTQLNNMSQNNMSIAKYGSEIESLFVDLTISQANSNEKAYEILRPLNEQIAIKKFADGIRNRRLSTIISARNYTELKDAVRAAEDEEASQPQPSTSNSMLHMRGKSYYRPPTRGRASHNNGFRGNNNF